MAEKAEMKAPEEFIDELLSSFRKDMLELYRQLEAESSKLEREFDAIEFKTRKRLNEAGLSFGCTHGNSGRSG